MAADCIYITQDCFWNIVIYAVCQNKRTAFRVFDSYILDEILETAKRRLFYVKPFALFRCMMLYITASCDMILL
jgi:hypothetical protein